ncbi:hypothetical protein [Streptomyces natalensis]|uniref:Uncharacterized protein n=1 Tax=Streptomyces natalensis ATCC 27448 TaxID=1240678 RepID=A0A0D7CBJ6_9ACTN|nr:hypothetical protein [Streptomyces natalensis]KIZ13633.1 hypothetical protein SNA_37075 [Streptomyces natalensis ATCC 27448]
MSSAAIHSASVHPPSLYPVKGATALGPDPVHPADRVHDSRHVIGNALRAVRVFVAAAFSVAVLGEYGED